MNSDQIEGPDREKDVCVTSAPLLNLFDACEGISTFLAREGISFGKLLWIEFLSYGVDMLWLLKIECFWGRFVRRFPFGAIPAPSSSIQSRDKREVLFNANMTNRTDVGLGLGIEIKQAASRELESEGFVAGTAVNQNHPRDRSSRNLRCPTNNNSQSSFARGVQKKPRPRPRPWQQTNLTTTTGITCHRGANVTHRVKVGLGTENHLAVSRESEL